MLHEVILALLGHPGAIIQEEAPASSLDANDGARAAAPSFRVPDSITFLTSTEREAINRVVGMGSIYRDLRCFVRPTYGAQEAERGGLYLRALKLGVCEVLDEYAERVAEVERDVMADPTLPLARVYAGVREVRCLNRTAWWTCSCAASCALPTAHAVCLFPLKVATRLVFNVLRIPQQDSLDCCRTHVLRSIMYGTP